MSRFRKALAVAALAGGLASLTAVAQQPWDELGRAATEAEIAAWDIDVRPDFKGLPPGSGSVDEGMDLWEETCAVCHGIFGEANTTFTPLVGGTSAEDVETGHVGSLARGDHPGATTFMKVPTISTIWDYIYRAMPWDHPKSLSADQVYAVTAYLLNLAEIVPDDFELSNENMAEVQERMPNRKGMTLEHAMWPGDEFGTADIKPDVQAKACMENCGDAPQVTSEIPDTERNTWGNLREQNRSVGPQRGADTSQPEGKLGDARGPVKVVGPKDVGGGGANARALALIQEGGCAACHGVVRSMVGPAYVDIAKRYPGEVDYLTGRILAGGSGDWGDVIMPPQDIPEDDARLIAEWIAAGAEE